MPDELYNHIQSLAAENNLTLNRAVIHLLQQAFQTNTLKMVQERPVLPMSEILHQLFHLVVVLSEVSAGFQASIDSDVCLKPGPCLYFAY